MSTPTAPGPGHRPMPDVRWLQRLAALIALVSLALLAGAIGLLVSSLATSRMGSVQAGDVETVIAVILFSIAFPVLGWVILRRLPGHRLGWVYLTIGFWEALNLFSTAYSARAYQANGSLPFAAELSWLGVWAWAPAFTLFSTLGIVLFPTGHLPSRRWWPIVALTLISFVILAVPVAITAWPYRGLPLERANALNVPPPENSAVALAFAIQNAGQFVLLAAMIGSVAGLVARFRRSHGVERQQLKWFIFAAALDVAIIVVWFTDLLGVALGAASAVVIGLALPVAIGVAILRYRLYDIDLIVRRTLVYAILTAALGAVYVGLVLGLQQLLSGLAGSGGPLAVAISTLAVAALFQPVRRRIQAVVDRRFDRARYDAAHLVDRFSGRLREHIDLDELCTDLVATTDLALRPASASVWLRRSEAGP
jgi:hypothetical protein